LKAKLSNLLLSIITIANIYFIIWNKQFHIFKEMVTCRENK
jgi:hypothetical protein